MEAKSDHSALHNRLGQVRILTLSIGKKHPHHRECMVLILEKEQSVVLQAEWPHQDLKWAEICPKPSEVVLASSKFVLHLLIFQTIMTPIANLPTPHRTTLMCGFEQSRSVILQDK